VTTPPAATQEESQSWFSNALGMAGAIVLCCGIGPFAIVTAIERDSSSGGADKGGVLAPGSAQPSTATPATRSPLPSPPTGSPAPQPPPALSPARPQIPLPQAPVPPPSVASPEASAPATSHAIGESVRDGQFDFVVRGVQCGLELIGSVRARGQFCVVTISVRNIGDRPQTLFEMDQKAIGGNGTEYSSHSIASLIANEPGNTTWLSEIKPGGEAAGAIVYELPKGIDLARLVLNDPIVPGGVSIALR
jgi:hypothetical protein